jgi:hypothetical protein
MSGTRQSLERRPIAPICVRANADLASIAGVGHSLAPVSIGWHRHPSASIGVAIDLRTCSKRSGARETVTLLSPESAIAHETE